METRYNFVFFLRVELNKSVCRNDVHKNFTRRPTQKNEGNIRESSEYSPQGSMVAMEIPLILSFYLVRKGSMTHYDVQYTSER